MRLVYGLLAIGVIFGTLHFWEMYQDKKLLEHQQQNVKNSINTIVSNGNKNMPKPSALDAHNPYTGVVITKFEKASDMELVQYLQYDAGYNTYSEKMGKVNDIANDQQALTTSALCSDKQLRDAAKVGMIHHFVYTFENGTPIADFKVTEADCQKAPL